MALWKRVLIGAAVLAVLGGIGGVAALILTAGADKTATAFVTEIAQAGPDAAYRDAAPALRLAQSPEAFSARMRQWRLTETAGASWPSRSFADGRVTVTGTVKLRSGETLPLKVELVKVGQAWAVSDLTLDAGAHDSPD